MEVEISKIMPPTEGTTCQPWYFPHSNQAKHIHPPDPSTMDLPLAFIPLVPSFQMFISPLSLSSQTDLMSV